MTDKKETLGETLVRNREEFVNENTEYRHLENFFEEVEKTISYQITDFKCIQPRIDVKQVYRDSRFMYLLYDAKFVVDSEFQDLIKKFEKKIREQNLRVNYTTSRRFIFFGPGLVDEILISPVEAIDPGINRKSKSRPMFM